MEMTAYLLAFAILNNAGYLSAHKLVSFNVAGITCVEDEECSFHIPNSYCDAGQCTCSSGYVASENGYYCSRVKIGTKCIAGPAGNSFCNSGVAGSVCNRLSGTCECPPNYGNVAGPAIDVCVAAVAHPSCTTCIDSGGVCRDVDDDGTPDQCDCQEHWISSDPPNSLHTGCDYRLVPTGSSCTPGGNTRCSDPHATCQHAGDHSFDYYCHCDIGYVAIPRPHDPIHADCRLSINAVLDPACTVCEGNGGECYSISKNQSYSGCLCPPTKSSSSRNPDNACDTNHFFVDCTRKGPNICFNPKRSPQHWQIGQNLVHGKSKLCMRHYCDEGYCVFHETVNGWCIDGEHSAACGMIENDYKESRSFSGWVMLKYMNLGSTAGDLLLHAFCKYDEQAQSGNGGVKVSKNKMALEGLAPRPVMHMAARDRLGNDIDDEFITVRHGDNIQLEIAVMDTKGLYTSIRPEVCIVSNGENLHSAGTDYDLFIMNACPDQNSVMEPVQFVAIPGNPLIVQTGLFSVPKFMSGDTIYFHCAVRVCIDPSECKTEDCDADPERRNGRSGRSTRLNLPRTVHQLAAISLSKRSQRGHGTRSMFDVDRAIESPYLEHVVAAIKIHNEDDDDIANNNDRAKESKPEHDGSSEDFGESLFYGQAQQHERSPSSKTVMVLVSILGSSCATLVIAAVIFLVCFSIPRRRDKRKQKQEIEDIS